MAANQTDATQPANFHDEFELGIAGEAEDPVVAKERSVAEFLLRRTCHEDYDGSHLETDLRSAESACA